MKIAYAIAGSAVPASGYITLMDDTAGGNLPVWNPRHSTHGQVEELASNYGQGASVFTNALGNSRCAISLRDMCVIYATLDAALAASRTVVNALLNNVINLQVTQGGEVQYFPNCVFSTVEANVQGANVTWSMELTSQQVTNAQPN